MDLVKLMLDIISFGSLSRREKKQLEEKVSILKSELEARKQRAKVVAHDSRDFLGKVSGLCEMNMAHCDRDSLVQVAKAIKSKIDFFAALSDELLLDKPVSRQKVPVDLLQLLNNTCRYYRFHNKDKLRVIELISYADDTVILSDYIKITQVVNNLMTNAIKFSPPQGRIDITLSSYGRFVKLEVGDEGPGLSAAQIERVFKETLSEKPGHGYGLKIVGDLVKQLGGQIIYQYDQGAKFIVLLPIR